MLTETSLGRQLPFDAAPIDTEQQDALEVCVQDWRVDALLVESGAHRAAGGIDQLNM